MFEYYKYYIVIELMLLNWMTLIKQVHQKSLIFVTIGILEYNFKFQPDICNRSHDLLMVSVNLINITILSIKVPYHCCIISLNVKSEAIKLP